MSKYEDSLEGMLDTLKGDLDKLDDVQIMVDRQDEKVQVTAVRKWDKVPTLLAKDVATVWKRSLMDNEAFSGEVPSFFKVFMSDSGCLFLEPVFLPTGVVMVDDDVHYLGGLTSSTIDNGVRRAFEEDKNQSLKNGVAVITSDKDESKKECMVANDLSNGNRTLLFSGDGEVELVSSEDVE